MWAKIKFELSNKRELLFWTRLERAILGWTIRLKYWRLIADFKNLNYIQKNHLGKDWIRFDDFIFACDLSLILYVLRVVVLSLIMAFSFLLGFFLIWALNWRRIAVNHLNLIVDRLLAVYFTLFIARKLIFFGYRLRF